MKAHIIFCNDNPKLVVLDNEEKANNRMMDLKEIHWKNNMDSYDNYESYKDCCYWHIHSIEIEDCLIRDSDGGTQCPYCNTIIS